MSNRDLSRLWRKQSGIPYDDQDECHRCTESDLTVSHSPCCNSSPQLLDGLPHGEDESTFARHRDSNASRVSFHSVFGDSDDYLSSLENDVANDQITLVRNEDDSRCSVFFMEHVLLLYLAANALLRLNLLQVFRVKECIEEYEVTLSGCEELQSRGLLLEGEINNLSNDLLLIRDALQYTFGAVLTLVSCQYMSKYGIRHPLFVCLFGTWLTSVLLLVSSFSVNSQMYLSFMAILPAVLTGGDILMLTAAAVGIAASSKGNSLRWRFFIYEFIVFVPEMFQRLLDLYVDPTVFKVELNAAPICLIMIAMLVSWRLPMEHIPDTFNEHTLKQRIRCAFGLVGLQETVMCFTRRRDCKGRRQLLIIIVVFAIASAYTSVFSVLRTSFLDQVYKCDLYTFTTVSSAAMGGCFVAGVGMMATLTRTIRPLDPLVIFIGYACLTSIQLAIALSQLTIVSYYAALSLQVAPVIGAVYLRSHLCQLVERSELAPLFSVICTIQRSSPLLADSLSKMFVTSAMFVSYPFVAFVISAGILTLATIASMYVYSVTRRRGYPVYQDRPTVNFQVGEM